MLQKIIAGADFGRKYTRDDLKEMGLVFSCFFSSWIIYRDSSELKGKMFCFKGKDNNLILDRIL